MMTSEIILTKNIQINKFNYEIIFSNAYAKVHHDLFALVIDELISFEVMEILPGVCIYR